MITRMKAIENLSQHIDKNLFAAASGFGIAPFNNGKQNKGWKGLTLELLAGLTNDNKQAPNGLGFELKSCAFHQVRGVWKPKETFAITMINPKSLAETEFFDSHCWEKLKSLVFCAVSWHGKHVPQAQLLKIVSFDFLEDDVLLQEIKNDYDFIRAKLINEGFEALTGKDGKWIQARTKGAGHGSTSRAFYARTNLIRQMLDLGF